MEQQTVLIVDDDKEIVDSIELYLQNEGYRIIKAYDGLDALEKLQENPNIHLILLDIMMPRLDGIKATLKIREERNIPILLVSAKSEDADKIIGLNIGADDYITKPFNPLELIARVKSHLRRYTQLGNLTPSPDKIVIGSLCLDTASKTVSVDGEEVKLTGTEYRILELLMRNPNRVYSADDIYRRVWNSDSFITDNTVAVHIRKIREKIEIDPKRPNYLKVVWGIGYKIEKN